MTQLDVDAHFAFALLEVCFLGQPGKEAETEMRRGQPMSSLFQSATAQSARIQILSEAKEEQKSAEKADAPTSTVKREQKAELHNFPRFYQFFEQLFLVDLVDFMVMCKNIILRVAMVQGEPSRC